MTKVSIIYPADPCGLLQGGPNTFIEGILNWAPSRYDFEVVGITTDERKFEVGKWHDCESRHGRIFRYLPILHEKRSETKPKIPLSLRFALKLIRYRGQISGEILELHRFEPMIALLGMKQPKTLFIHMSLHDLGSITTDLRWNKLPSLFYLVLKTLLRQFQLIHCVRHESIGFYQTLLPDRAGRFHFTTTWYEPDIFHPISVERRRRLQQEIQARFGWRPEDPKFIYVGRLEDTKDPLFLVKVLAALRARLGIPRLILVGDGRLRPRVEQSIQRHGLTGSVKLLGVLPRAEIASLLAVCDAFLVASHTEGMPIAVLEALASGLPVISMNVGELPRMVRPENGALLDTRDVDTFADKVVETLDRLRGKTAIEISQTVQQFQPGPTLARIYARYDDLLQERDGTRPVS